MKSFKEMWYERNPVHEINVDTGEDMFWGTAELVAKEFCSQSPSKGEGKEDMIEKEVKKIFPHSKLSQDILRESFYTVLASKGEPCSPSKVFEVIDTVRAQYPENIFHPDGISQDAKSAMTARLICDNIKREMEIMFNEEPPCSPLSAVKDKLFELLYHELKFGCEEKCHCHGECNKADKLLTDFYDNHLASLLTKRDETIRELKEVLQECDDYFDNYADADYINEQYAPNPEMNLLSRIRSVHQQ